MTHSGRGWENFRRGLVEPSAVALVVAILTSISLFGTLVMTVDAELVANSTPYLAYGPHDDGLEATAQAIELRSIPADRPLLAFVGASSTRESLIPAEDLARELRARTGHDVHVLDMTMGGETGWEMVTLAEGMAQRDGGVVVMGVNPFLFLYGRDDLADLMTNPRIGVTSSTIDAEARRLGIDVPTRTGVYALDNRRFLLSRFPFLRQNLFDGPVDHERYRFDFDEPADEEEWTVIASGIDERMQTVRTRRDSHLGVLGPFIERVREAGSQVIILEPPINPRLVALMGQGYEEHQTAIAGFARSVGARYWRLNEAVGLTEEDYVDYGHLGNAAARERYSAELLSRLIPLIEAL